MKLILNYIKKHLNRFHAPKIQRQIDDGIELLLLKMQTDVILEYENKILIIEPKYFGRNISKYYLYILSYILIINIILPLIYQMGSFL